MLARSLGDSWAEVVAKRAKGRARAARDKQPRASGEAASVNNKLKTRVGVADLKTADGVEVTDDEGKADLFNNFFSSMFTVEDLENIPSFTANIGGKQLNNVQISEEEMLDLLRKLQPEKSPGPDGIHPRVLKECAVELSRPLTILFLSLIHI